MTFKPITFEQKKQELIDQVKERDKTGIPAAVTAEQCEAILRNIVERCNDDDPIEDTGAMIIGFGPDWGGNALTVFIDDSHTYVGSSCGSFARLVDSLHKRLIGGKGMSLAISVKEEE